MKKLHTAVLTAIAAAAVLAGCGFCPSGESPASGGKTTALWITAGKAFFRALPKKAL